MHWPICCSSCTEELFDDVLDLFCLPGPVVGKLSIVLVSSESSAFIVEASGLSLSELLCSILRENSAASFFFFDFSFNRRATSFGRWLDDLRQFLHLRQQESTRRELTDALELNGDSLASSLSGLSIKSSSVSSKIRKVSYNCHGSKQ